MLDSLETIVGSLHSYGDLPETWRVPEVERFSSQKTLYDYQANALRNAARALYRYYGGADDWQPNETPDANDKRKRDFMGLYVRVGWQSQVAEFSVKRYERNADKRNEKQNIIFKILSEYISPENEVISYHHFINRMCFWMATGSGKTLVMVKLIEYLHFLKRQGVIPPHNILILAPSNHLIGQIRGTIDEFNQSGGLQIKLTPLRDVGKKPYQEQFGDSARIYYHRSDNISDVQKDALTDYRTYENDGKWYVLLDEAHKGGKEESKRQAYYALMAREGFLFNFSATFTDKVDIVTTVKKYNLEEFTKNGYGKSIYLNEQEYVSFQNREREISHGERRKIVLKSLITLAYVSMRVDELRKETGFDNLYHRPLMLTLVNSVNTDIENEKNDLWAFFQTLREIATGEIDTSIFKASKDELIGDWKDGNLLFGGESERIIGTSNRSIKAMRITDLRAAIFLSRRKGALQFIRSRDNKELAFQMKNADSPFALIRIGDTSKWRNKILAGYEETTRLQEKSFFAELEKSPITILMGSRTFFESWDSNRPNVINFINIGGSDAKKFVVQSVGRGVRIEILPGKRGRFFRHDFKDDEKLAQCWDLVQPPETLFIFATNRAAIQFVLQGLETEKSSVFEKLEGFEKASAPKIGNRNMPLLVPEYKEDKNRTIEPAKFAMSGETLARIRDCVKRTSDSVFAVRDGLETSKIAELRNAIETSANKIQTLQKKDYATISFLQHRLVSHLSKKAMISHGVRNLGEEDIVHFRDVRAHPDYAAEIQSKIRRVKQGKVPTQEIDKLNRRLQVREITQEQFIEQVSGKDEESYKELTIKKLANHYYSPVVLGKEKINYIWHIIKVESEVNFLNRLEEWIEENTVEWDAWMFSKIDESLDRRIYIPYYDSGRNEYRRFLPDFIFWMCKAKENECRIVFVDPKGGEHTDAYRKIEGYKKLFEKNDKEEPIRREFSHGRWKVSVDLLMYNSNPESVPLESYKRYWTTQPGAVFKVASPSCE